MVASFAAVTGLVALLASGSIVDVTGPSAAFGAIGVVALAGTLVTVWLATVVAE